MEDMETVRPDAGRTTDLPDEDPSEVVADDSIESAGAICDLLRYWKREGLYTFYRGTDTGCLTVNMYDDDGDLAARQEVRVFRGKIVRVRGRHSFTCSCL